LRLFSFGSYGLALAALALVVFGAIECPPYFSLAAAEKAASVLVTAGSELARYKAFNQTM